MRGTKAPFFFINKGEGFVFSFLLENCSEVKTRAIKIDRQLVECWGIKNEKKAPSGLKFPRPAGGGVEIGLSASIVLILFLSLGPFFDSVTLRRKR
jgi:hypothetical protein